MLITVLTAVCLSNADITNTTINTLKKYAWSSTVGWISCRPDITNGMAVGQYVCSGYMYSPTIGWISVGNGMPTNGIRYATNSATDYGVNHDGKGHLSGFAWSPSIGWISFQWTNETDPLAPTLNVTNGVFSGYAYGPGAGFISLSGASMYVKTDIIIAGTNTSNTNGIPDAWIIESFGSTNVFTNASFLTMDSDTDGVCNLDEYLAGTDPTNKNDFLSMNEMALSASGELLLTWRSSKQTRCYKIEKKTNLMDVAWADAGTITIVADSGTNVISPPIVNTNVQAFFRIRASLPTVQ